MAAPAFSAITRQVLLYRGVHPERDRPSVWVGQPLGPGMGRTMLARFPPAASPTRPAEADDALADGDEHDDAVGDPPIVPAAAKGGHPHAPV